MNTITSRERLDRCYRNLETDRPGLYLRGITAVRPAHESYRKLRELVLEKSDLVEDYFVPVIDGAKTYFHDILAERFPDTISIKKEKHDENFDKRVTTLKTPAGELTQVTMVGLKKPPYIVKHFIETPEDAYKYLTLPDDYATFDPEDFFSADRKMGERGIVVVKPGQNPIGSVVALMGSENFAYWTIERRDLLHALAEKKMNLMLKTIKELLDKKAGPYFALSGEEYVVPPLHGPKDFYDFNVRYDKPLVDLIHNAGGLVHIHSHGSIKKVMEGFMEIGMDVLHPFEAPPMGDITIEEAKNLCRGRVCIEGNIQIADMYERSAGEIREMAKELIKAAFDDSRGLIVSPSASPYIKEAGEKALETYGALMETVIHYGRQ